MEEDTSLGKAGRGNEKGACWEGNVLTAKSLWDAEGGGGLEMAEEGRDKGRET